MTPLPILLAAIFLGTGNCSYKIVHFFLSYGRICKSVIEIFWDEVFIARNTVKQEDLDVWPLFVANEALLTMQFRGGSRRRVQGVRTPSPSWDDLRFSNTTGILQKKKTVCFIGVEVEQGTSAPPPKKNPGSAPAISPHSGLKTRVKDRGDTSGRLLERRIWLVCSEALFLVVL